MHTGIIMGFPTTLSMNLVSGFLQGDSPQVVDVPVGNASWMGTPVTHLQVLRLGSRTR